MTNQQTVPDDIMDAFEQANQSSENGQYARAQKLYESARKALLQYAAGGPVTDLSNKNEILRLQYPLQVAEMSREMGTAYKYMRNYAEADKAYAVSRLIYETAESPDHPDVAVVLGLQAAAKRDQGDFATASGLFKRGLIIIQTATKGLMEQHPLPDVPPQVPADVQLAIDEGISCDIAIGRLNQKKDLPAAATATDLTKEELLAKAETAYRNALAVELQTPEIDKYRITEYLQNQLGNVLEAQGRYAEALPVLVDAKKTNDALGYYLNANDSDPQVAATAQKILQREQLFDSDLFGTLGRVSEHLENWQDAAEAYANGLDIAIELFSGLVDQVNGR